MEVRNIGFGAVNVNELKAGIGVIFNKHADPHLVGQSRIIKHIGAETKAVGDKVFIDPSRKLIKLFDSTGLVLMEDFTAPINGTINCLDILG